jgi:hypothetical protein
MPQRDEDPFGRDGDSVSVGKVAGDEDLAPLGVLDLGFGA